MTTKLTGTSARNDAGLEQAAVPLHGVLLYEDFTTGLRAKAAFDHLRNLLDAPVDPRVDLWRFDLLAALEAARDAAREAADADLMVVSAHDGASLSPGVRDWLNDWSSRRWDRPCLLVLSLDRRAEGMPSTAECLVYLQRLAEHGGMDLLSHFGEDPPSRWDLDPQSLFNGAPYVPDDPAELQKVQPRWGINE